MPKNSGKVFFSGNYYVKFGHFLRQKSCKILEFCYVLGGKYHKNSGILIIFRGRIM